MKDDKQLRVDVGRVLREKNPGAARYIPGFVTRYLRRIVHEKELNRYLESYSHLPTIEFIRASLHEMGITYRAEGMTGLDPGGRYIFASNHPFGGIDGLMLAVKVHEYFGDVRVVVNDILMNLTPLNPIFVPVNKHGRQNPEYLRLYKEAFESHVPIITFPAGLCSRKENGVVQDLPWRPNFIKQAIATQRDIVPVYFSGQLSNFFYRLSNFRKKFGIKANIEMLYLADEMFKQRGHDSSIIIGKPISWTELGTVKHSDMAAEIRTKAYELAKTGSGEG